MGRSLRISLRAITLVYMLLGASSAMGATVGLLVDAPSPQISTFLQQLQAAAPKHQIKLIHADKLTEADIASTQKWVTLGPKALSSVLTKTSEQKPPTLALFLPDEQRKTLRKTSPKGFTYLDNAPSLNKQLALIKIMVPQAAHVGVYYSSMYDIDQNMYKEAAKQFGLNLHFAKLNDPLDWDRNALKVLTSVDLVLGVDDNGLYNTTTIRSILMRLYRSGKALIGPDKGYVRAGAVASVHSGIGETLKAVANWINNPTEFQPVLNNPYFDVSVNQQVARSLNIVIEDEASLAKQIEENIHEK